ncbi:hypothetical protein H5410_010292 [Solanum commersonii]|uniref:Uncharacterized protein n=1 Tax=Solanum commersonii TaxID=4109 RepID=A0A9J6ALV3_SOLCO|nr:hypothetical protein H5410_010292 [Solanum commersonii]
MEDAMGLSLTVAASRIGPGIRALTNIATEIFSGKLSMALDMANPPRLWPTRITVSYDGREAMNSISGLK